MLGPTRISDIAEAQAIPARFLEIILGELKKAGFVDSTRGANGGYFLTKPPQELMVGEVIRFMEGPIGPVECLERPPRVKCCLYGNCALIDLWRRAYSAMSEVYDTTSFHDLVVQDQAKRQRYVANYSI